MLLCYTLTIFERTGRTLDGCHFETHVRGPTLSEPEQPATPPQGVQGGICLLLRVVNAGLGKLHFESSWLHSPKHQNSRMLLALIKKHTNDREEQLPWNEIETNKQIKFQSPEAGTWIYHHWFVSQQFSTILIFPSNLFRDHYAFTGRRAQWKIINKWEDYDGKPCRNIMYDSMYDKTRQNALETRQAKGKAKAKARHFLQSPLWRPQICCPGQGGSDHVYFQNTVVLHGVSVSWFTYLWWFYWAFESWRWSPVQTTACGCKWKFLISFQIQICLGSVMTRHNLFVRSFAFKLQFPVPPWCFRAL